MRRAALLLAVLALWLVASAASHAELDRTPNMVLLSTKIVEVSDAFSDSIMPTWEGEFRQFRSRNSHTWSVGGSAALDERTDLEIMFSSWRNGDSDPIAGAVRSSRWDALSVNLARRLSSDEASTKLAVVPFVDLSGSARAGKNEDTGDSAFQNAFNWGVAVVAQGQVGGCTVALEPKYVNLASCLPTSRGGTIDGYGQVVTIGAAATRPLMGGTLMADVQGCVSGRNSIDRDTGDLIREIVWSAGWRKPFRADGSASVELFATNAAGPSMVDSVLVAVNNGAGVGARVAIKF